MAKYVCLSQDDYGCTDQCWCFVPDSDYDPPTRCLYAGKKHRIPCWMRVENDAGEATDFCKCSADPSIRTNATLFRISVNLCGKDYPIDPKN